MRVRVGRRVVGRQVGYLQTEERLVGVCEGDFARASCVVCVEEGRRRLER